MIDGFSVFDVHHHVGDASAVLGITAPTTFVRAFSADRVAFGTDLYSWPLGRQISPLAKDIVRGRLSDTEKQAVLAGNARRLFKLA